MAAERIASLKAMPYALAAGSHASLPYLAAGSVSGYAKSPADGFHQLRVLHTNPAAGLLQCVAEFWSPAGFCSLDWAKPTEATCWRSPSSAGLIAGGLENGTVAIWDPRSKLGDIDSGSSSMLIENYFTPKPSLPFDGAAANMVAVSRGYETSSENGAAHEPVPADPSDVGFEDDLVAGEGAGHVDWAGCQLIKNYCVPKDLPLPAGCNAFEDLAPGKHSDAVALLNSHDAPVKGLSFSLQNTNFLASAALAKLDVWDITNPSLESIPIMQFVEDDNLNFSHLSWSPLLPHAIASTSNFGAELWDPSVKSHLIRKFPWQRDCSTVEWSPNDSNLMVVGAGDLCNLPAVKVWDLRKMDQPLFQFCENVRGFLGLSWCPFDYNVLSGCTNKNTIITLNVKEGQVLDETPAGGSCLSICWTKSLEDCFVVSCSEKLDVYYRSPEI